MKLNTNKDYFNYSSQFKKYERIHSILLYGTRIAKPRVSIMIPTFMRNELIVDTINSALNQKCDFEYEIVVVDNNADFANDDLLNIIRSFRSNIISYYKNEKNIGMFGNHNRCIELSNSNWLLILSDDDMIDENYLSTMIAIAENDKSLGCIGCENKVIDENGNLRLMNYSQIRSRFISLLQRPFYYVELKDYYFTHPINIMGLLINKDYAIKIGGFDEDLFPISDVAFIGRMMEVSHVAVTDKKLLSYRHAQNESMKLQTLKLFVTLTAEYKNEINKKLKLLVSSFSDWYISYTVSEHISDLVESWTDTNISVKYKTEMELSCVSEQIGIIKTGKLQHSFFSIFHKLYRANMRFIRKSVK